MSDAVPSRLTWGYSLRGFIPQVTFHTSTLQPDVFLISPGCNRAIRVLTRHAWGASLSLGTRGAADGQGADCLRGASPVAHFGGGAGWRPALPFFFLRFFGGQLGGVT